MRREPRARNAAHVGLFLVGKHLDKGDAAVVIDDHMDMLSADAAGASVPVSTDPVADARELA